MFSCDPVLLLLFVILMVMIALIVREFAVNNGLLEGPKLFDGSCDGAVGGMMVGGSDCLACGGEDFNIM
jgi:hypothetical protein